MASGITHILLMKYLQEQLPESKLKKQLASGIHFLQVGAVGPDLPYASIADDDFILANENELAKKFHNEKTNQVPLVAFKKIKELEDSLTQKEKRFLFCFFLGFVSHIIADGIIHPFVRDKVGNYNENKAEHRILEMQLDVLLFHHINNKFNLNYSNIHDELKNLAGNYYPEVDLVLKTFSQSIEEVYNIRYEPEKILGWIIGLHRMFDLAEGEHPKMYKNIGFISDFLFKDYDDLRDKYSNILELTVPVDRKTNFLNKNKIHFFDDCLPRFYEQFIPVAEKCYNYIYGSGNEITEMDLLAVDLDTGRELSVGNNLELIPTYWS